MRFVIVFSCIALVGGCSKSTDTSESASSQSEASGGNATTGAGALPAHEQFMDIMAGQVAVYTANQSDCNALSAAHAKWFGENKAQLKELLPKFDAWTKALKDDPAKAEEMKSKYKDRMARAGFGGGEARKMMRKVRVECSEKLSKPKSEWFPSYEQLGQLMRGR